MSELQYVGARYVPKFAEPLEWNKTRSYEALTIVTYNNDSYTSKIPVPPGTEITNSNYWALTGQFNSQVAQYQKDVSDYKADTDSKIEGLNEDVENVDIQSVKAKRTFVIIGDALSTYPKELDESTSWPLEFTKMMNGYADVISNPASGASFVRTKEYKLFQELLDESYSADNKYKVTDVILCVGDNDATKNFDSEVLPAIKSFESSVYQMYPNCKLWWILAGSSSNEGQGERLFDYQEKMENVSYNNRTSLHNIFFVTHDYKFLMDSIHPNQAGASEMAKAIFQIVNGGKVKTDYGDHWFDPINKSVHFHYMKNLTDLNVTIPHNVTNNGNYILETNANLSYIFYFVNRQQTENIITSASTSGFVLTSVTFTGGDSGCKVGVGAMTNNAKPITDVNSLTVDIIANVYLRKKYHALP